MPGVVGSEQVEQHHGCLGVPICPRCMSNALRSVESDHLHPGLGGTARTEPLRGPAVKARFPSRLVVGLISECIGDASDTSVLAYARLVAYIGTQSAYPPTRFTHSGFLPTD